MEKAFRQRSFLPFLLLVGLALAGAVPGLMPLPTATPEQLAALVPGDMAWMLTAAGLVLLMTPGLSYFYGGMVSRKNVISTMLQSFIALGVVSLLWVVVGFSLAFGDSVGGVIGSPTTYFFFRGVGAAPNPAFAATIPLALYALFQLKFAIITPALITGAFAERVRFSAYLVFITLFTLFIYAPLAHWTWHPEGFLRRWGVLDFAGGTVVHISAGVAALVGALVLGPRKHVQENGASATATIHEPANVPFVLLGTGMLWFGWFGFNAGSALAANATAVQAFLTTNTASAAAMLAWIFFDHLRGRRPTALGACIGAVVGLVAITPAAGYVTVGAALFIGVVASVISNLAVGLTTRAGVDDTLDVFPCHGLGGIVGMILTGVFAQDVGLMAGKTDTFVMHLAGVAVVIAYVAAMSWLLYRVTNWLIPLRVGVSAEAEGLDLAQHGERYAG
jgi:ammonium transporter, Amt family